MPESVARLVATDPRWSAAHRALSRADAAVRADLSVTAALPTKVPDDVAAQIDAAIRRLTPEATVASLDAARAKRRRAVMAGFAAAAATVVAVVGGIALNTGLIRTDTGSPAMEADDGRAGRDAPTAPAPAASALTGADPGVAGGARVLASGTDYRLETLPQLAAQAPPLGQTTGDKTAESPQFSAGEAPGGLARLTTSGRSGGMPQGRCGWSSRLGRAAGLCPVRRSTRAHDRGPTNDLIDDHRCRPRLRYIGYG